MTDGPRATSPRARLRTRLQGVRWGRLVALGLLALAVSLVFGLTTASVRLGLGPHEARYDVTTDDTITLDVGPLGTLQIDSPLPLTLGARVTVKEIPADVRAVDPVRTLAALSGDLQGYVQFFSGPEATIADATRALVTNALLRTGGAFVLLVVAGVGSSALLGPTRRSELATALAPHRRAVIGGGLLAVAVVVTTVSSVAPSELRQTGRPASSVFDGTPLEGARITGRLAGVIDTYGGQVVEAYQASQAFYEAADDALVAAWEERAEGTRARVAAQERLLVQPDDGSTPTETADVVEPVVMVLVSDLHCNVGMAPLIRSLAELSGAQLVLDAGDTTVNGTAVEQYCATTFARAVPEGATMVAANGNHDSTQTAAQQRRAGVVVLDGEVVTVAGVRILGDSDPNETRVGGGTRLGGEETVAEVGERLAETACDDGDVDVLLTHLPRVGDAALESGCVPVQLAGHTHRQSGPAPVGEGLRLVSGSTAGATAGAPTVGPLRGTAHLTVLRFDPAERRFVDHQPVAVRPDGSVAIGYPVPFPRPEPAEAPGTGDGGTRPNLTR
ncbi:metallophosphoesterase [Cellulomonas fimi]|uniref:Metallophosphoesterase n=1 Tax=Cellulomonas fimi TaxID=1708 RepID=A0A7Y0QGL0_CELFI|nr:metallophosphoesterase [Cellulomonas fimi]NMR19335.1 metallophosphoesterase [Cellulomonas fimi]